MPHLNKAIDTIIGVSGICQKENNLSMAKSLPVI